MIENRSKVLKLLKDIGFVFVEKTKPGRGIGMEYKYYPTYLDDYHYTVVFFIYQIDFIHFDKEDERLTKTDFRFYSHFNRNKSFKNTHQLTYPQTEIEFLEKLFQKEILQINRINKLERIIED